MSGNSLEMYAQHRADTSEGLTRVIGDRQLAPYWQTKLLAPPPANPDLKKRARESYQSLLTIENKPSPLQQDMNLNTAWLKKLGLNSDPCSALALLPRFSVAIDLSFTLARPYLSKDDDDLYPIDNPVRKEKVFKLPYVAASGWKGALHRVALRHLVTRFGDPPPPERSPDDTRQAALFAFRAQQVRLFGNENKATAAYLNERLAKQLFLEPAAAGERFTRYLIDNGYRTKKVEGRQGRLFFFPTFFKTIGLEVINPRDRERGAGTQPILLECVPAGAIGKFRLLYVPYDILSPLTPDVTTTRAQMLADLPAVAHILTGMLGTYGFGAKTSSGYGRVDPASVTGKLTANAKPVTDSPDPPFAVVSFAALGELAKAGTNLAQQWEASHD